MVAAAAAARAAFIQEEAGEATSTGIMAAALAAEVARAVEVAQAGVTRAGGTTREVLEAGSSSRDIETLVVAVAERGVAEGIGATTREVGG